MTNGSLSLEELLDIQEEDFNTTSTQALLCFCLDTSRSMAGSKINELNNLVNRFIEEKKADFMVSNMLNVSIVVFGGLEATTVLPFTNVSRVTYKNLTANGGTHMSDGVNKALNLILNEKKKWVERGTKTYKPMLIIMSDGEPDEPINEVANRIKKLSDENKVDVYCVGYGIEDNKEAKKSLEQLCPRRNVELTNEFDIENFFVRLSRSMSNVSRSFAGTVEEF